MADVLLWIWIVGCGICFAWFFWAARPWEKPSGPTLSVVMSAALPPILAMVGSLLWPVTVIVVAVERRRKLTRWRLLALDYGFRPRWWHGAKRIARDLNRANALPHRGTLGCIRARIYDLTGCQVSLETPEPGMIIVVPDRHRHWRRVWCAVKEYRDDLVPACNVISVRIPKKRWWEVWR